MTLQEVRFIFDTGRLPWIEGHVKWFGRYDLTKAPLPIDHVLTKPFIYVFLLSVFSMYLFFLADRAAYRKGYFIEFDEKIRELNPFSVYLMRICAGVFFVALAVYGKIPS